MGKKKVLFGRPGDTSFKPTGILTMVTDPSWNKSLMQLNLTTPLNRNITIEITANDELEYSVSYLHPSSTIFSYTQTDPTKVYKIYIDEEFCNSLTALRLGCYLTTFYPEVFPKLKDFYFIDRAGTVPTINFKDNPLMNIIYIAEPASSCVVTIGSYNTSVERITVSKRAGCEVVDLENAPNLNYISSNRSDWVVPSLASNLKLVTILILYDYLEDQDFSNHTLLRSFSYIGLNNRITLSTVVTMIYLTSFKHAVGSIAGANGYINLITMTNLTKAELYNASADKLLTPLPVPLKTLNIPGVGYTTLEMSSIYQDRDASGTLNGVITYNATSEPVDQLGIEAKSSLLIKGWTFIPK